LDGDVGLTWKRLTAAVDSEVKQRSAPGQIDMTAYVVILGGAGQDCEGWFV
jgi:hypothetical protein